MTKELWEFLSDKPEVVKRHRAIVEMRLGLNHPQPKTLVSTGVWYDQGGPSLSRERVHQIVMKAFRIFSRPEILGAVARYEMTSPFDEHDSLICENRRRFVDRIRYDTLKHYEVRGKCSQCGALIYRYKSSSIINTSLHYACEHKPKLKGDGFFD